MNINVAYQIISIIILLPLNSFVSFELKDKGEDVKVYVYDGSKVTSEDDCIVDDVDVFICSDDDNKDK